METAMKSFLQDGGLMRATGKQKGNLSLTRKEEKLGAWGGNVLKMTLHLTHPPPPPPITN